MTREFPALGFDPAPGTVSLIQQLVDNLGSVAKDLGNAHDTMLSVGQSGSIWEGEAADAFQNKVGELPKYLSKANHSLSDAANVLRNWADDLTSMQQTADGYELQAADALQSLRSAQANPDLGLAGQHFDTDEALQQAKDRYDAAKQLLDKANADLDQIREAAKRLLDQHQRLADDTAKAIKKAKNESPKKPGGLLHGLTHALGGLVKGVENLAKSTWQFVEDHADLIAKIGDVLSEMGTVLSVVAAATAWIPGVDLVTTAAAAGVSGMALEAHLLAKAAGAKVSWSTVAFDALGAVPGGGEAKSVGGVAKVLPKALKAGKAAEKGAKIATGMEKAGAVLKDMSLTKLTDDAKLYNKYLGPVLGKVAIHGDAVTPLGEMTKGAIVAGAGVDVFKTGVKETLKPYVDPYIDDVKERAKSFAVSTFSMVAGRHIGVAT